MLSRFLTQLFRNRRNAPLTSAAPAATPIASAGRAALDAGDFALASTLLQQEIDRQPTAAQLRWEMAHAQAGLGNVRYALSAVAPMLPSAAAPLAERRLLTAAMLALAARSTGSDADRRQCAELLGNLFLERGAFDAAQLCAGIMTGDPDRKLTYRVLALGGDLPGDCDPASGVMPLRQMLFSNTAAGSLLPAHVCALPGAMVLGHRGIPVSSEWVAYPNRHVHNPSAMSKRIAPWNNDVICLTGESRVLIADAGVDEYAGVHILIGHSPNFGHWMLNHFGRLRVLEEVTVPDGAKLLVPDNIGAVAKRSLALAGYPEDRLTLVPDGRIAHCETLLVPSMLFGGEDGWMYWSDEVLHFIRRKLTPVPAKTRSRRILVTRKGARWRYLQNEDAVLGELADLGFESVELGALDLDQQIALAAESDAIVGSYGAGMSIALLAHPGTAIVEIKAEVHGEMDIHPRLAAVLGTTHAAVSATAIRSSTEPTSLLDADLVCDPAAVRATVIEAMRVAAGAPR